jgi:CHASE2 domain-containing sensor protein
MKVIGGLLIALALLVGIVPMFSDCESQDRSLTLANGREIPMKCHWTGLAELAMAAPLLVVGALMTTSKRTESLRNMNVIAVVAGIAVILLSSTLIGVCANPDMRCNAVMRPSLILAGSLVVALGVVGVLQALRRRDETA